MTLVQRKYTQTHSFDFSLLCSKIATLTIKNQYFAFAKLKIMFHSLITMRSTTEIQILKQFWDLGFFHVSLNVHDLLISKAIQNTSTNHKAVEINILRDVSRQQVTKERLLQKSPSQIDHFSKSNGFWHSWNHRCLYRIHHRRYKDDDWINWHNVGPLHTLDSPSLILTFKSWVGFKCL